jgi:dienelactone hydrolase
VVSFHGSLGTPDPAQPGKVKARVLVLNGADDPLVTAEQIAAFKQEMAQAGVSYTFINYPGARHSFTSPAADALGQKFNMPLAYNENADRESWAEMQRFLKSIFK